MDFLPISLRVRDAGILLVGGGEVATRKARLLLRAGARLQVVAPDIDPGLEAMLRESGGRWQRARYSAAALDEVVAGRTVDHAEVEAWVAGFGYKDSRRIKRPECA